MEQELIKKIVELLPRIKTPTERFTEEELVPIKAFWEEITNLKIGNMLNCGGLLCEDVRRSIVNYMRSYRHVKTEAPKKTIVKVEAKKIETLTVEKEPTDSELLQIAKDIAKEKGLKKPHHKTGRDKLISFIEENK